MTKFSREQESIIRMRISQLETEQTVFYRDHNVIDRMANDRAILELKRLLGE